jgi:C-terminal AAA-associated domain
MVRQTRTSSGTADAALSLSGHSAVCYHPSPFNGHLGNTGENVCWWDGPRIDAGKRFVQADLDQRKRLFAQYLLTYVPLAGHIKRVLDERATHRAPASRFRDELEDYMPEEKTLRAIISWARYGEAFAYDEDSGVFSLENPA